MRIQKRLLFLIIVLFLNNVTHSCDCKRVGPFINSIKNIHFSDLIIRGVVIGYGPLLGGYNDIYENMKILVTEKLFGKEIEIDTVTIYGDPGFLCRPYIQENRFPIGNEYIFYSSTEGGINFISSCVVSWLPISKEMVCGWIQNSKEDDAIKYNEFCKIVDRILNKNLK